MIKSLTTLALAAALAFPLSAAGKAPRQPQHPVNLNTASVTELMQLPRIGQKTAARIVAFRKEHGGFQRPEELMNVKGIGEKAYARIKPFLAAALPPASAAR
jgi:competence protein ComEA